MHCPPRAVQGCCCCYAASFPPYTALNKVTIGRGCSVGQHLDTSAKWLERVEVCASQQNMCTFTVMMKVSDE